MTRYDEFLRFIIPLLELRATPETSCLGVKFSVAGMNLKTPQISHKSSGFLGQKNTEIVTDHPRIYPWSRMVLISHMVKGVIGHPFWITPNILLKLSKRKSHCRPFCHKTNVSVDFLEESSYWCLVGNFREWSTITINNHSPIPIHSLLSTAPRFRVLLRNRHHQWGWKLGENSHIELLGYRPHSWTTAQLLSNM